MKLRFPDGLSRRAVGIAVTLAIELLFLLMLLSLGIGGGTETQDVTEISTFDAREQSEQAEAEEEAEQTEAPSPDAQPQPQPTTASLPIPPTALPRENTVPVPPPAPLPPEPEPTPSTPPTQRARAVIRPGANFGPADTGRRGGPDSQIVGTAPDGSPLYAARWYTEPTDQQLAGFLSGARGPGWGLIACKTAPNWRVEDCEVLGESPAGSNMGNSVNAAAWQFLVRPPRVGGEYLVGSWVRILITVGSGRSPGR